MEEQNKYYTPTIEELHVGWEGEASFVSGGGWVMIDFSKEGEDSFVIHEPKDKEAAKCWSKFWLIEEESLFTANNTRNYETAVMLLKDNRLRGKYLDQEDIESLGWIDGITEGNTSRYNMSARDYKDRIFLLIDNPTRQIRIVLQKGLGDTLFWGECKSKNELRKIMQWVGIM
jgi:hypothetical protein